MRFSSILGLTASILAGMTFAAPAVHGINIRSAAPELQSRKSVLCTDLKEVAQLLTTIEGLLPSSLVSELKPAITAVEEVLSGLAC